MKRCAAQGGSLVSTSAWRNYAECVKWAVILCIIRILHIVYILIFAQQNRSLLDTLRSHPSNNNLGYMVLYSSLPIGCTKHPGHFRVSSWLFAAKKLQKPIARTWRISAARIYFPGWVGQKMIKMPLFALRLQRLNPSISGLPLAAHQSANQATESQRP